jgi:hypothetical protein
MPVESTTEHQLTAGPAMAIPVAETCSQRFTPRPDVTGCFNSLEN